MAKFLMGGRTIHVPEMNFAAVERAWPFIDTAMKSGDMMDGSRAAVCVIAAGIMECDGFNPQDWDIDILKMVDPLGDVDAQVFDQLTKTIKRRLQAREMGLVTLTVIDMVREAGLMPEQGELIQVEDQENPSTVIAEESLQS